jgi:hypothetical protein
MPTQAVRHTCSGNLGIVKILGYIRSDIYTASTTNSKPEDGACSRPTEPCTPKHNGKSGTGCMYILD